MKWTVAFIAIVTCPFPRTPPPKKNKKKIQVMPHTPFSEALFQDVDLFPYPQVFRFQICKKLFAVFFKVLLNCLSYIMIFSMPRIIQHTFNFFSSRTPKPILSIFSSCTPNPKLLTAKLQGTGKNPRPRIRPLLDFIPHPQKLILCSYYDQ